ncbi:hypothetical protein H6G64_34170 [Calothrix sp. FACHB-156]|nr:hypothetical protein [Calothrix sp. FACHB-156]
MTESPNPETLEAVKSFATALNSFAWNADYIKFCEVLGFTPDSYAEEKYQQFRELVSYLDCFDPESLARMIEAGK